MTQPEPSLGGSPPVSLENLTSLSSGALAPGGLDSGHQDVPEPPLRWAYSCIAFLFSAVLSPYIVIPVGTVAVVAERSGTSISQFWLWSGISIFFSTGVPALYVLAGIARGRITDVHVMERGQRGGPFLVAIVSSMVAAIVLHALNAPTGVWGLNLIVAANGVVLWGITTFYKISMHVAVLSAVVIAAWHFNHNFQPIELFWLVPALIWARQARGRHSAWQGISGCAVASVVTGATLTGMHMVAMWRHVHS